MRVNYAFVFFIFRVIAVDAVFLCCGDLIGETTYLIAAIYERDLDRDKDREQYEQGFLNQFHNDSERNAFRGHLCVLRELCVRSAVTRVSRKGRKESKVSSTEFADHSLSLKKSTDTTFSAISFPIAATF